MQFCLQCTDDVNSSNWNICNMSLISFWLAVIFIISPKIDQIWWKICSALGLLFSTAISALAKPFQNRNA